MNRASLSAAALLGALCSGAWSHAAGAEEQSTGALDEIVITARHREEKLLEVPDTVRALTAEEIESAGINNVKDAVRMVSNAVIFADQQPGVQTVTLRGISQARGADSEQAFAFVVDGVTSPTIFSFTQDLYDIERLEVLKGPQGALYGRNAIGGAINVITRQPSNEFQVGAQASYAEGNETRFGGRLSGPIIADKLLFRLSGSYIDYDGQLDNVTLGAHPDFLEERGVRGQLEAKPTDALDISLRASWVDTEGGGAYNAPATAGAFGAAPDLIQEDHLGVATRELQDFSAKLDWETGIGTLTSITAYTDADTSLDQDLDFTGVSVAQALQFLRLYSWMQELRLSSPSEGALRWSFGGFVQDTDREIQTLVFINRNGPIGAAAMGPGGTGNPSVKDMANTADRTPMWDFESRAAFGSLDYDFTPQLTLTAGFRWDQETRDFFQAGAVISAGHKEFEEFQPKVSLAFKPSDALMVYGTYATGFRPGGFNPFIGYSPDGTYEEETTTNYEVGLKSAWLDRRLTFNLAAFYIESDNTQQRLLNVLRGQAEYFNIGDSEYQGAEAEVFFRATERLYLEATYGYTDSEITGINPAITNVGNIDPLTFIGNRVPRVNQNTASIAAQYEMPITGDLRLVLRGDYSHVGRGYWYLDNADQQEPYDIGNFRVSLRSAKWSVTGYVENAFDEEWHVTFNNTRFEGLLGGLNMYWPSPPRQVGLQISYDFL
jgi:iron complex outermembrane recepter protein